RLAHRMGSAAFLAPDTVISPLRRLPPTIWSLSIRVRLVFGRRQGAHGQCVDLGLHALAQRAVHQLVAGDKALALEGGADDQCFEVGAVALNLKMLAGKMVGDVLAYLFGG